MFSLAVIKAAHIYGISIVISMLVAVLIKVMVSVMGRMERPVRKAKPEPENKTTQGIPDDVVAALSAAIAVVMGPHKILHIEGSQSSWAESGRAAHHASHSGQFKPAL